MAAVHELHVDGRPAGQDDLAHQALVNYGAYTAFGVEAGGVRGLDRHLSRLEVSAVELFGEPVGEARLRDLMRRALGVRRDAWLRVSLFSPDVRMRDASWRGAPKVMIGVSPTPPPLAGGLRVQVQTCQREAAHLKHVATFGLMRARRLARDAGFDDALFADGTGVVSEGTVWNVGFLAGDTVTWPQAPMLAGVTQALVQDGLSGVGLSGGTEPVRVRGLARFDAAFLCNSATPAASIAAIGDVRFAPRPDLIERLTAAWASNAPQSI